MKNKLARLLPAFQRELRASRARRQGLVERDQQRGHVERLARIVAATGAEKLAMETACAARWSATSSCCTTSRR
jgi:hypothetical protein